MKTMAKIVAVFLLCESVSLLLISKTHATQSFVVGKCYVIDTYYVKIIGNTINGCAWMEMATVKKDGFTFAQKGRVQSTAYSCAKNWKGLEFIPAQCPGS